MAATAHRRLVRRGRGAVEQLFDFRGHRGDNHKLYLDPVTGQPSATDRHNRAPTSLAAHLRPLTRGTGRSPGGFDRYHGGHAQPDGDSTGSPSPTTRHRRSSFRTTRPGVGCRLDSGTNVSGTSITVQPSIAYAHVGVGKPHIGQALGQLATRRRRTSSSSRPAAPCREGGDGRSKPTQRTRWGQRLPSRASTSPASSPSRGPTRWSAQPTSWSPWAAAPPLCARSCPGKRHLNLILDNPAGPSAEGVRHMRHEIEPRVRQSLVGLKAPSAAQCGWGAFPIITAGCEPCEHGPGLPANQAAARGGAVFTGPWSVGDSRPV
jgi:hypothetical protein